MWWQVKKKNKKNKISKVPKVQKDGSAAVNGGK